MAEGGIGAEMIRLIQISFSVLNQLLLLKSPDLPLSPVESALSSQPVVRQNQHIVATIAQYIYHKHNPRLPMLACLLLKRLALVSASGLKVKLQAFLIKYQEREIMNYETFCFKNIIF